MNEAPSHARRDDSGPKPTLVTGGTLLTMDPEGSVLDADLSIVDGRIHEVLERRNRPDPPSAPSDGRRLAVDGCLVLPGLIQGHLHLGQTLFRGLAEGRHLLPWLEERIWPLEAAHDDESAYWSGLLGAAECLLSGTTTIQDIGIGPGSRGLLQAILDSGLRAVAGHCLMDEIEALAPGLGSETEDQLQRTEELGRVFDGGGDGRFHYSLNPRFILSCSDQLWRELHDFSERTGWPIHTHALEHLAEGEAIRASKGCDEIEYFDRHGLLARDLRIAHGVQLTGRHLQRVGSKTEGAFAVCHCPSANLKLGSGIADLVAIRGHGVPVAIGADGAACNNDLCVLEEIRLAALLQNHRHGPGAFSSRDALELATREGARALGLGDEIGSLEPGKAADLVVLDTGRPELWPPEWADSSTTPLGARLADQVVYAASRASVRHVVVQGELVVEDGRLLALDLAEIRRRALDQLRLLLSRARV